MKKLKKVISIIIIACVLAGAVFFSLYFMGIIKPSQEDYSLSEDGSEKERNDSEEPWQIVFKGFEFYVKPMRLALIHESGCLNIRNCDEYLIQIDVEDMTADDFWNNREKRQNEIEAAGYVMQLAPEKIEMDGREYIRYIVSLENERGSDFENSYYYVLISEASEGKRILAMVRFDGIDVALLDREKREALYEKALIETTDVINSVHATEKKDDATGSCWEVEEPIAYLSKDSLSADKFTISYHLPEGYDLMSDDEMGKTYYSKKDQTHVTTSINSFSWLTAKDMVDKKNQAGISKIMEEGEYEVNGLKYFYYTYSVMHKNNDEKTYWYYFVAYADLENGDIYSINAFSKNNANMINKECYYDFMNIEQSGNN